MPAPPLTPETFETLQGYTSVLAELIGDCAAFRRHEPEFFLWNARRALEAVCLILLTAARRKPVHNKARGKEGARSLDDLIKELDSEGIVDEEHRITIHSIRASSNPGVHIRTHKKPDLRMLLENVDRPLTNVIDWLFDQSPAATYLRRPEGLDESLRQLRAGGREEKPLHQQVEDLRAELEKARRNDDESFTALQDRHAEARRRIASLEAELSQSRRANGGERLLAGGVGALMGAGLILAVGQVAPHAPSEPVVADAEPAAVAPATESAPPAPTCPEGMIAVGGMTVHLGQPFPGRDDWPRPSSVEIAPFFVDSFCIDVEPVHWGDHWHPALAPARRSARCASLLRDAAASDPGGCAARDEAERYCAERLVDGRLPTLAEWEVIARTPDILTQIRLDTETEWIADRFPPRVLNRAPDPTRPAQEDGMMRQKLLADKVAPEGNVLWSWNRSDADLRLNTRGFRCATSAGQVLAGR